MTRKHPFTAVLFDLDGTLLPMDTDQFTKTYFSLLTKKAAEYGYTDAKAMADAVWTGTKAMVKNDGSCLNCDRFWQVFAGCVGQEVLKLRPVFDAFYGSEFHGARIATRENPMAKEVVDGLKADGCRVILATNPLFPMVGQATRLSWIGLKPEDFALVTCYENSSYCKPNPAYFTEIAEKLGLRPEECLVVGNDVQEDLAARTAGMEVYLVTDCLIDREGRSLDDVPHGSFSDMMEYLGLR